MANDLIIALRRKRMADQAGGDSPAGADAPGDMPGKGGDMAKYWAMMQDMNGKLDHLISLLGDEESKEQGPAGGAPAAPGSATPGAGAY